MQLFSGCHDIQHNDTQQNDIQQNDIQHNDTQHKKNILIEWVYYWCHLGIIDTEDKERT